MHLDAMEGKTVVITGATSGIGQVAAETLAWQGGFHAKWDVAVT
jgi:short-subunit dehydrogenase